MIHQKTSPNFFRLFWFCSIALCLSCGGGGNETTTTTTTTDSTSNNIPNDFTVRILIKGNPDVLNPLLAQSAISREIILNNVYNTMLEPDPETFELKPYLAVSRPNIETKKNGKMYITYEIRPEANWDNGTPITAEDYIFSLKCIKNPKSNAAPWRPFFEFVEDIIVDPNNNKKFTIVCNSVYILSEAATGSLPLLPTYFYDPQNLMSNFKIPELNNPANLDKLNADPRIIDFAKEFNDKYNHEPKMIVGSGPYIVTEIANHQHVKLERKKDWWGDKVDVDYIAAYPEKIMYRLLDDDNNAILSLKEQALDVMTFIPEEHFLELKENKRATDHFNLYTPNSLAYRYIGFNMKSPKLDDVRVRKALAHLLDKKYVVEELCSNLATPVIGPVNPTKPYYNKSIVDPEFDVDKAKQLLTEAGWKDTDGDNILDKMIGGQKVSMKLKFLYPQGKQFQKDLAQILKDEAIRVGIEIEMHPSEWSVMLEDNKKRNYDLISLGWGQGPELDDFKQIWHTSSNTAEGSNSVGFGNKESDALIDKIRETMDETERNKMYLRFQEIVAEQQPYIFLVAPKMCTAISKRFTNAKPSSMRPGYRVRLFQLANK